MLYQKNAPERPTLMQTAPLYLHHRRERSVNISKAEANDHSAIWVAIVAAVGVVGAAVAPGAMKRRQDRQDQEAAQNALIASEARLKRYRAGFVDQIACYEVFNTMLRDGADRVILWAGKNTGGVPTVGKPYTVTPVQGVTRFDTENIITSYKNLPVDLAYIQMLLKSLTAPLTVVINDPETMESGILKEFYQAEGITQAILVGLGLDLDDNTYNYISIATHRGKFTPQQITKFRIASNEIWQLILAGRE